MAGIWTRYLGALEKYPLLTMTTSTAVLMATGDSISQLVVERRPLAKYDLVRTGRFFVFGFVVIGPMMKGWYKFIDKLYTGQKYTGIKMMATDQIVFSPVIITTFITGMAALRMEGVKEIQGKWKRDFVPIILTNWKIWPIVQLINFNFMPLQHRVLFVNFVALFWNTYLSWVSEQSDTGTATDAVITDITDVDSKKSS